MSLIDKLQLVQQHITQFKTPSVDYTHLDEALDILLKVHNAELRLEELEKFYDETIIHNTLVDKHDNINMRQLNNIIIDMYECISSEDDVKNHSKLMDVLISKLKI